MTLRFWMCGIALTLMSGMAMPAYAELSCDAIDGEDPLYAEQIDALGRTMAPPGCDQSWSQAMRARRNANLSDGIVVREETWGLLIEEKASGCMVDGTAIDFENNVTAFYFCFGCRCSGQHIVNKHTLRPVKTKGFGCTSIYISESYAEIATFDFAVFDDVVHDFFGQVNGHGKTITDK